MTFSLTVLGSSSALPTKHRFPTAHVLNVHERFFLVDCGEGAQMQLRRYGIKLSRLNHIFISHMHGDHMFGIYGLLSTLSLMGRTGDLHVYGVKQLEYILNDHLKYFGTDCSYKLVFHEVNPRKEELVYEDKGLTVHSIPLKHRIPTSGYLFREKTPPLCIHKWMVEKYSIGLADIVRIKGGGDLQLPDGELIPNSALCYLPHQPRSYAFCSDTQYSEKVVEAVKGIDLLYHEATFGNELLSVAQQTGHSTAKQAATVALEAGVKQLVIGHYSSRYPDERVLLDEARTIFPNTELADEGRTFDVPLVKYSG